MSEAVARAITVMWQRYAEPIELCELAEAIFLSRFYFSRLFRGATGTSPGRFLAAIRLHEAKRLLLESPNSVTEISYRVGYNSPGTFTSRFTRSVGISPTRYREISDDGLPPHEPAAVGGGVVRGRLRMPETDLPVRVYVGAFETPVCEGVPVAADVLDEGSRAFCLADLPNGSWHVRAVTVERANLDPLPWKRRPLFIGHAAPVVVRAGRTAETDIALHERSVFDLPVLQAIPELDCRAAALLARSG